MNHPRHKRYQKTKSCQPEPVTLARRVLCLGLLALWILSVGLAQAEDTFQLSDHTVIIPERGQVLGCALQTEDQRLTFIPPDSWKATVQTKTKEVNFLSPDRRVTITLQLLDPDPTQRSADQTESWRSQVQKQHPQGRLVEEFACYIGEGKARGFDVETTANGQALRTRTCFGALPPFTVQFHLRAPSDVFAQHHWAFASMMGSLRLE